MSGPHDLEKGKAPTEEGDMMTQNFEDLYNQRLRIGRGYKEKGKKVFGYLSNYVPEELFHAAGIIPVRIRGAGSGLKKAGKYLPPNVCSYLKTSLDEALLGSYDYLDGFIATKACDAIRNFFSIWEGLVKPSYSFFVAIPSKNTPAARDCFVEELKLVKTSLEEYLGKYISEDALKASINIYNENRAWLTKIQKMRMDHEINLPGSLFHAMLMAGLVMPKEEHTQLLKEFLNAKPPARSSDGKIPVAMTGNTFEDMGLLRLMEKHGGDVKIEDTSLGRPYYTHNVDTSMDPLSAIAARYLEKSVEPYRDEPHQRIHTLISDMETHKIRGLINVVQKYCDEFLIENVPLVDELRKHNIPFLTLDMDDTAGTSKQIETRIQAFLEMLTG
jgi:benzoyl-CoA reductase subunit C